jgi:cyclic lactone autoinducer peptide
MLIYKVNARFYKEGGVNMRERIMKSTATAIRKLAEISAESTSFAFFYQPPTPKSLKKADFQKNKKGI